MRRDNLRLTDAVEEDCLEGCSLRSEVSPGSLLIVGRPDSRTSRLVPTPRELGGSLHMSPRIRYLSGSLDPQFGSVGVGSDGSPGSITPQPAELSQLVAYSRVAVCVLERIDQNWSCDVELSPNRVGLGSGYSARSGSSPRNPTTYHTNPLVARPGWHHEPRHDCDGTLLVVAIRSVSWSVHCGIRYTGGLAVTCLYLLATE